MPKYLKWLRLLATAVALTVCGARAQAQQPGKVYRIGYLAASAGPLSPRTEPFRQGLRDLGYFEGKNFFFESRAAEGQLERLRDLAAELVRLNVDVIVAIGDVPIGAARQETITIPIVMLQTHDPVELGHVVSLAKPAGNVTGLSTMSADLAGKRIELLKEIIPKASRVALLRDPRNPATGPILRETVIAARALGLQTQPFDLRSPEDFERTFRAAAKDRVDALIVAPGAFFRVHQKQLLDSIAKYRMPTMHVEEEYVLAGGFISYAASADAQYRRAAWYVDKILKGAKPRDLPVEQPTKFELVINLNTAKQIGVRIPPSVLARADRVIK